MKAGTLVELSDGRRGVVTYHNLDGYGINTNFESLTEEQIKSLNTFEGSEELAPDVMLRDDYPSAEVECHHDFEVVSQPTH